MDDYDLIVVGAGPGGSNAAAVALRRGLRVAQLERRRFPRVKPCAGGLTRRAERSLVCALAPALRRTFEGFELNLWQGGVNRFTHRGPILHMVLRPEFDDYLVRQNRAHAGFHFFDGEAARDVRWQDGRFLVQTEQRPLTARQLVGADGANGLVNRVFRVTEPRGRAVAVEVNLHERELRGNRPRLPCFDFGVVERGYGWVFPKDELHSVGLYTLADGVKDLRERLARYVAAKGFEVAGDPLASFEAHTIPLGGHRLRVPDAPVYVVGDAGGFADALTGEGIWHALESGRLAGDTASSVHEGRATHALYYRRLKRVVRDTWLSWHAARWFYDDLERGLSALRLSLVWRPLVHGFGRGATLAECIARGAFYLVRSALGRTAALTVTTADNEPPPRGAAAAPRSATKAGRA